MKIEKLRNNHKKEIIIGTILTVVIGGALTFKLTHSKYRVTQSIDLGSGVINYTSPDFKIMAVKISEDGETYSDTNIVPSSGYILNSTKSTCKVSDITDNNITIEYNDGKINFLGVTQKGTKCYLYFDKIIGTTVDNIIASVNAKTTTPDFSKTATGDEGVFKAEDGMYGSTEDNKIYTYYWRGAATTNHVIFANKCWRIVRINGDKTMRLIYNGPIIDNNKCTGNGANADAVYFPNNDNSNSTINLNRYATPGNDYNNASYVGWTYSLGSQRTLGGTASNAKIQTENWYKDISKGNLTAYEDKIADGKYCNDRNTGQPYFVWGWGSTYSIEWSATGTHFAYASVDRLINENQPTYICDKGDTYTLKVGAITTDEVVFAGGVYSTNNDQYYMYIGQDYWTMSPCLWSTTGVQMFYVYSLGDFGNLSVENTSIGLRPVINLKSNVTFSSGNGTQNQPYVVS